MIRLGFKLGLSSSASAVVGGGGGGDVDATAFIAAVNATAASVSPTQEAAIEAFYATGKSEGWYTLIKRAYLPIWADASANAIDMVTRNTGTFGGAVTHAAGYVQGDGSSGRFLFDVSPSAAGLTLSSAGITFLSKTAPASNVMGMMGCSDGGAATTIMRCYHLTTPQIYFDCNQTTGAGRVNNAYVGAGIILLNREGGNRRIEYQTTAGGFVTAKSLAGADAGTVPTVEMAAMARHNGSGAFVEYSNGQMGFYSMHEGMTTAQATQYSAALKTLWETCTGLTLP